MRPLWRVNDITGHASRCIVRLLGANCCLSLLKAQWQITSWSLNSHSYIFMHFGHTWKLMPTTKFQTGSEKLGIFVFNATKAGKMHRQTESERRDRYFELTKSFSFSGHFGHSGRKKTTDWWQSTRAEETTDLRNPQSFLKFVLPKDSHFQDSSAKQKVHVQFPADHDHWPRWFRWGARRSGSVLLFWFLLIWYPFSSPISWSHSNEEKEADAWSFKPAMFHLKTFWNIYKVWKIKLCDANSLIDCQIDFLTWGVFLVLLSFFTGMTLYFPLQSDRVYKSLETNWSAKAVITWNCICRKHNHNIWCICG